MKVLIIMVCAAVFVLLLVFIISMAFKLDFFNMSHFDDPPSKVFLSFKNFITYYNLNPDRYIIDYDLDRDIASLRMIETKYRCSKFKIKFKYFSFIRFYYWDKRRQNANKKKEYNKDIREMLKLVQEDIDNIRERAEKKVREAERITNEVGGRL